MRVITRSNGAAHPASKRANLRSTRGADRKPKVIMLKCNKKGSQMRDSQQEPRPPKPGAEEDDDGYWQLLQHAKCDARFYTAPHPWCPPPPPEQVWMGP